MWVSYLNKQFQLRGTLKGPGGGQKVFWKHLYRDDNAELTSKISHILLMFCYDNLLTRTISIHRKDTQSHCKVPVSLFIECSQPEIKWWYFVNTCISLYQNLDNIKYLSLMLIRKDSDRGLTYPPPHPSSWPLVSYTPIPRPSLLHTSFIPPPPPLISTHPIGFCIQT